MLVRLRPWPFVTCNLLLPVMWSSGLRHTVAQGAATLGQPPIMMSALKMCGTPCCGTAAHHDECAQDVWHALCCGTAAHHDECA